MDKEEKWEAVEREGIGRRWDSRGKVPYLLTRLNSNYLLKGGHLTMEKAQTTLWDSVDTDKELRPKIVFDFNVPVEVEFGSDFVKPVEYPSQYSEDGTGTYCVFDVIHQGDKSAIVTSAYSLLRGIKKNSPLAGKKLIITKKMEKGKQHYVVENKS